MVKITFENINSSNEYINEHYFKDFKHVDLNKVSSIEFRERFNNACSKMIEEGICSDELEVNVQPEDNAISIKSKTRGISIGTTFSTDKSQQTSFSLLNPLGKGGRFGIDFSIDLVKKINGEIFFSDKKGHKMTVSRVTQPPIKEDKTFRYEESALTYSLPPLTKFNGVHLFSVYSGNRKSLVDEEKNLIKEHHQNQSITSKCSLTHQFKYFLAQPFINPESGAFGKIQTELALPGLSCCPLIKTNFSNTFIFPLFKDIRLHASQSFGAIYKFNKQIMTPLSDRFFNDKSYLIEGFQESSLITSKLGNPYLGGDFFQTLTLSLVRPFKDNFNVFVFSTAGNSVLAHGNNVKSSMKDLFDYNKFRFSIGGGILLDVGQAFLKVAFVKPYSPFENDSLKNFGFDFQIKI
ncbi:hypothetical protein DLAC_03282 [Tieghemostelium lacteum]|uniref:Bacterial surface antigen (D15) domain-containing protein n=1 Tax=Tieghemostelium lacteum TaxID=361077 RepID=A0A152A1P0_TIELA|nr:hypothetical protein DLAC_03282 [Tieghemostelium lacteum]|eukprot:KYR00130.1 hypothetical protein DLAC_03282 [Tieghemostelium lacteum]